MFNWLCALGNLETWIDQNPEWTRPESETGKDRSFEGLITN